MFRKLNRSDVLQRKGMIKRVLVPNFNVPYHILIIFSLIFPLYCFYIGYLQANYHEIFPGWTLLVIVWMLKIIPRHKHSHWKVITDLSELYKKLPDRNKELLLKRLDSPFAKERIAYNIGQYGDLI